jgi:potassium-transporting ATPase KdpC subunit
MKKELQIAFWMTVVTTVLFGIVYPIAVTILAQAFFPAKANGELIQERGVVIGSKLIGQEFSSPGYFYSRPSNGNYDGLNSGGSNLGPTNRRIIERVEDEVRKFQAQNLHSPIPVDLVTASASGLDPDISIAAAEFQIPRVARVRGMSQGQLRTLVERHVEGREFGILGEPRVNVLELNLALDAEYPTHHLDVPARDLTSLGGSKR